MWQVLIEENLELSNSWDTEQRLNTIQHSQVYLKSAQLLFKTERRIEKKRQLLTTY